MNLRAPLPALFAALLATAALPVFAAPEAATAQCPAALAAEYQLDGVMETGSGLLLRGDCSFEWFFSYGALDLAARGRWQADADGIALAVEDMRFPPQMPETKFERMHLRIDGTSLVPSWPWDMDEFRAGAERGSYERVEP
jgi:hypothetical protein